MQRFIITEDAVNINVTTHRPQMTKDNNTQQQVDFTVNYTGQNIIDPYRNPRDRYDRLIGSVIANTLNRLSN